MNKKGTEGKNKINNFAKVKYVAKNHYITSATQNKTEVVKISPEKYAPKNIVYPKTNEYNFSTEGSNKDFSCENSEHNFNEEEIVAKVGKTQRYVQKVTHQKARHFTPVQHSKLFSVARNANFYLENQQENFSQYGVNHKSNILPRQYFGVNARKVLYEEQRLRDRDRDDTIRRPRTICIEKNEHKVVHIEDDSEEEIDNQQIRKELFDFIIHESLSFKLPNKTFIKKEFRNREHYMKTIMPLVKEQISATIIQAIQKIEENYQKDYLKISIRRSGQAKIFSKDKDELQIDINERDEKRLKSILLQGACLGIITKSLPINLQRLISHDGQSYLCLVRVLNLTGRITVEGLDDLPEVFKQPNQRQNYGKFDESYLRQNQFYFVDLTPITSFEREYIAVSRALQSPLIQTIINNTPASQQPSKLRQRKQTLQSKVFNQIQRNLNPSQVQAIKSVFQNEAGIYLIQGPPGTGKTQCITNLISLQYYHQLSTKQNKKILVCAQSNAAVDHIARKIMKKGLIGSRSKPQILKLGAEDNVYEEGLDINLRHICQIDVLDIAGKTDKWSVSLMSQLQKLKQQLQKKKQRKANFNDLSKIQMSINRVVAQLQRNKKDLAKDKSKVEAFQREHVDKCQIIFSTLNTSGNIDILNLVKDKIACVIIDEASQATEPSTLIPLLTGVQKMILVGDHMQLQPTVMSKKAKKTQYSRSLFERLVHCGVKPHLLNIQYRMHPQLNRFSSMYFYDNKVKNGSKLSTPRSLLKMKNAALLIDLQYTKEENRNKSYYNQTEALCINRFVKMLLKEDMNLEIGIISPYSEQIKFIQAGLQEQLGTYRQKANVRVSTVDAFQGQEVDVVIFSCVRANNMSKIGFLDDKKRLNVAITRAKHAAIIFGNMNTFKQDDTWKAYIDHHNSDRTLKTATNVKSCLELLQVNIFGEKRVNGQYNKY